ncbi:predicted protein [Naegleria gruberi]|uniref:Predicted protein n=1 Tax=Naegleria gruberi TaxID=5762 RepID=D2W614_NAEGR|nr:uncharacterized protein NAEGRDRAFT_54888 [Naegleria gruberi]EFC35488.1 predicted protein [Naegleria gruberi]|eukprot:XP_002668232.1 predicted protein [Naegleria gruberi strain NEG-M]
MTFSTTFNRWRINDVKQKKSILKTQLNSLQSQIQQAQELSIEKDHILLDLEQVLQDQQELHHNLMEAHSKLDDIYSQMKQHHTEELLQIEKRIKATEEYSQRVHNEKIEYRHQLDQNELIIAQLEETIAKEEAYFIQKRNACMNIRIDTTHIVADHKQNFDSTLTSCEKSQMDTFEYIKEIAQYTSSEMQKCINNSSANNNSLISSSK